MSTSKVADQIKYLLLRSSINDPVSKMLKKKQLTTLKGRQVKIEGVEITAVGHIAWYWDTILSSSEGVLWVAAWY